MKAYQVAMFLIFINAGFFLAGHLGVGRGITSENITQWQGQIAVPENMPAPSGITFIGGTHITLGLVLGAIVTSGMLTYFTRTTTWQVVGIWAFTVLFWGAYVAASASVFSIIQSQVLVDVLTFVHWMLFVVAIVGLATGRSPED